MVMGDKVVYYHLANGDVLTDVEFGHTYQRVENKEEAILFWCYPVWAYTYAVECYPCYSCAMTETSSEQGRVLRPSVF